MKRISRILAFALALVLVIGVAGIQPAYAADGDLFGTFIAGGFINRFTEQVQDISYLALEIRGGQPGTEPLYESKYPASPADVTDIIIYYNGTPNPVVCLEGDHGYMFYDNGDGSFDTQMQLVITPYLEPKVGTYYATFKYRGVEYKSSTLIIEDTVGGTREDKSTFGRTGGGAAVPAPALTAKPTASTVLVNGENVAFDAYNINGNNYFKLRDLAYILNGTEKQFEVTWDGASNAISLISGKPYTAVGGEMTGKGAGDKTPAATTSKILLDGEEVTFTAYNIEGNNYFKLRDVGQAFDFGVDWDGANNTIVIDTSKGYTPE